MAELTTEMLAEMERARAVVKAVDAHFDRNERLRLGRWVDPNERERIIAGYIAHALAATREEAVTAQAAEIARLRTENESLKVVALSNQQAAIDLTDEVARLKGEVEQYVETLSTRAGREMEMIEEVRADLAKKVLAAVFNVKTIDYQSDDQTWADRPAAAVKDDIIDVLTELFTAEGIETKSRITSPDGEENR